jgi:hypothetical protein
MVGAGDAHYKKTHALSAKLIARRSLTDLVSGAGN